MADDLSGAVSAGELAWRLLCECLQRRPIVRPYGITTNGRVAGELRLASALLIRQRIKSGRSYRARSPALLVLDTQLTNAVQLQRLPGSLPRSFVARPAL